MPEPDVPEVVPETPVPEPEALLPELEPEVPALEPEVPDVPDVPVPAAPDPNRNIQVFSDLDVSAAFIE